MARFTDRYIRSLKPQEARYDVLEARGFSVRVFPNGTKSFFFVYTFEKKRRRVTLGNYPGLSLQAATEKVNEFRASLERGVDPVTYQEEKARIAEEEKRREEEAARIEAMAATVAGLASEYLEKWAKPRKRSWREDARILAKDVVPRWGERKAKQITRRDIISLLDEIVDRGSPIAANRTLAVIRKMFNFALSRDIVPTTPCAAIKAPSTENRRDRALSSEEIKIFWSGLDGAGMVQGSKLALKLMLVTAQRAGEVTGASWEEVDLSTGWWTITALQSKNKMAHRVPLSSQALEILAEVKVLAGESIWLFPSPKGENHIGETALGHAVRRNLPLFGIEQFTPHDLRRTAASHMTGMGISRLVVSKILNHAEPGITAVYDRHSYDREKLQALETWGRRLEAIAEGRADNVVEFTARQATG